MGQQKREYTHEERNKILTYIIENEGFYNLRGNAFWKEMEDRKILSRSWQSMKEHFRMKIITNLNLYNLSNENIKKIITGYNNTKSTERVDDKTIDQLEDENIEFSDEDITDAIKRSVSSSSDNLANVNKPSTPKKEFRKRVIKNKSERNVIPASENVIINNPVMKDSKKKKSQKQQKVSLVNIPEQNESIVTSSNLGATCTKFGITEDNFFLKAITKYDSNFQNCACVVTFIKQYNEYHNICQSWIELYDKLLEILSNLRMYDFLEPETVLKLQKIKVPLEKYRLKEFQDIQNEVISVRVRQKVFKVTLAPDPELIYLKPEQFDVVKILQEQRNMIFTLTEKISTGEVSEDSIASAVKVIGEFKEKYSLSSINNNQNEPELAPTVEDKQLNNEDPVISIKQENLAIDDGENETVIQEEIITTDMLDTENQSNVSDIIPVQPEISLKLLEAENNNVESFQRFELLKTENLNATNNVPKMTENDLSDSQFFTCEN